MAMHMWPNLNMHLSMHSDLKIVSVIKIVYEYKRPKIAVYSYTATVFPWLERAPRIERAIVRAGNLAWV